MNIKKYFSLNHRVVFYVPSGNQSDKEFQDQTNKIAEYFNTAFGGATIEKVGGWYKMADGSNAVEVINKVISFTDDKTLERQAEAIIKLASIKAKELKQETIGLEIDNQFLLIN